MTRIKGIKEVHLLDFIHAFGEASVKQLLGTFSCPLNLDVENFIKNTAIEFAKQSKAQTYLTFSSYKGEPVLSGYYTIAQKNISIQASVLSKTKRKKALRCGQLSQNGKSIILSAPLIAQLGKNYSYQDIPKLISGNDLIKMACEKINEIQRLGGGNVMYLECVPESKLIEFYNRNGFFEFNRRPIEKSEKTDMPQWNYLVQMVKIR